MFRERALKVLLVLTGLTYLTGFLDVAHVVLVPYQGRPHEQMLSTVMAVQAIFLLLAVRQPAAHRSFIAFSAWSATAHSAVMAVQAWRGVLRSSDLPIYVVMVVVGIVFILLIPDRQPATRATP